jgi:hypothetical protein
MATFTGTWETRLEGCAGGPRRRRGGEGHFRTVDMMAIAYIEWLVDWTFGHIRMSI